MSRTRSIAPTSAAYAAALLIFGAAAHGARAQGISVTVNDKPVVFTGTLPREIKGAVLVPLRGVFEQMGATVDYDPATKTIQAKKGSNSVSLILGSTTALVNGQSQTLLQPAAVIDGTTLVPLRFVAQSFGGYVQWVAASQTVQIKTPEQHLSTLPPPPASAAEQGQIAGALTGVYTDTVPPQITLRVNGQNTAIPITDATIVMIGQVDQPATQQRITDLKTDRQVRVTRNPDGTAKVIEAVYGEVTGVVKSIALQPDGSSVINLTDGTSVRVLPGAPVTMGGRRLSLRDVMSAEKIVVRTDDTNTVGTGVAVVTADDPSPEPPAPPPVPMPMPAPGTVPLPSIKPGAFMPMPSSRRVPLVRLAADTAPPGLTVGVTLQSFSTNITGPLRGREQFHIVLQGTPGGKATYAIPNLSEANALKETRPGVYETDYKTPNNVNLTGAAIVGQLTARDGTISPTIPAAQTLTIDNTPPVVTLVSPPVNTTLMTARPPIYAVLGDGLGVGVDARSARLLLDGIDVTGQATLTKTLAAYAPSSPLMPGVHAVRLIVSDYLGNTAEKNWSFSVAAPSATALTLQSDHSGDTVSLTAGQTLGLTLHAPPGAKAAYALGTLVQRGPFVETAPGVYTALFRPVPGSSVDGAPVIADVKINDGPDLFVVLPQSVTVHADPPREPIIFTPPDGVEIGKSLTVGGRALPNTTVNVIVSYVSKTLGLFTVTGTAAQQQVITNAKGQWRTIEFPLVTDSLISKTQNTTLTVTAVAVDATGQTSDPAIVKVTQE